MSFRFNIFQKQGYEMRLLVVSNRLPITVEMKEGRLTFQESVGGLVSGLSAYLDSLRSSEAGKMEAVWVGWPGLSVDNNLKEELKKRAFADYRAYPVFVDEKAMDKFYYGLCNKTIWPLFHYFPSYAVYDEEYWKEYRQVNEVFCQAVLEVAKPDDTIWVHDYHLMLLPKLLREKLSKNPIGFFLHIPFPSFEIFRLFPRRWSQEILEGLLGADIVGFHTHDYTQAFLRCALRILGVDHDMGKLLFRDRLVKADTFPMGIHYKKYAAAAASQPVAKEKEELKKPLGERKVILSVDRLDYSKGILKRLQGYETFLEKNPDWHKKVVLLMIVVPSRVGVDQYQDMKKQIEEMVGKINGRFGGIEWTPLLYQYKYVSFEPLAALYGVSEVALITPLRDGMNLIAKEYIACRSDQTGVLILSEMAGAARELGEAIQINPNHREEIAQALKEALEMPRDEQVKRNKAMQRRLETYDVIRWAEDFLEELRAIRAEQKKYEARYLGRTGKDQLIQNFRKAKRRLIFLDYDGTLVPFTGFPQLARPTEETLQMLRRLSQDPQTELILVSGRDKNTLENWFGSLSIGLVGEHGVWVREKGENWHLLKPTSNDWKPKLLPILQLFADRLPGAFVEEKEYSLVWHYRRADLELGALRAKELIDDLIHFTANIDVQVLQGSKVVELRNAGVNKGMAALYWVGKNHFDFVLAIGDDWTDEDLFKALPSSATTIKVGMTPSYAKYNLNNHSEVQKLIEEIVS